MLFLGQTEQVGRVADLGLDLFLAITEVVVGNQRHDHPALVACADLEGVAVVVQLRVALVAHPVAALAGSRIVPVREAQQMLGHVREVRREDHTAGMAGPAVRVQRRIVFRQVGITAVSEDVLDEIQVRNQASRNEEADLHALFAHEAGNRRHNQRAQQQGDETRARRRGVGQVRKTQRVFRRRERQGEQPRKGDLRHSQLVVRDRHSAFGNVEHPGGRAPILGRVMQHAVTQTVAGKQG